MLGKRNFLKNVNPTGAVGDLVSVYRDAGPGRWRNMLIAGVMTFGVFSIMATQSWKKERQLPEIIYINSWPADRTEAETSEFIRKSQKDKEELQARQAAAEAEAQKMWMEVGRASGMDVEEIKARADAEKAKEAAKAKQALEQAKVER